MDGGLYLVLVGYISYPTILYGFFWCFEENKCEGGWNVVYLGRQYGVPKEVPNENVVIYYLWKSFNI
jgi:hypothetical protein